MLRRKTKIFMGISVSLFVIGFISTGETTAANDGAVETAVQQVDYFHNVKQTCDALLEHGTDRYGPVKTGMIISMLDRFSLKPFDSLPPAPEGLRSQDRAGTFGHNANLQFNLYRVLNLLSDITGNPKYRRAAQADLSDFLKYAQSPETGLLGWGEHLFYDLKEDKVQSAFKGGKRYPKYHEMKRKLLFWDFLYKTNPQAVLNFTRGLWDHQIYDQATGNFSRHALWDKHGPNKDYDFPKEGSYMIDVWSRSFQVTQDPVFQNAVNVLASHYIKKLNPICLIDFDTARPDYCDNTATLSLAIECENAAKRFGKSGIGDKLEFLASEIDKGFLALDHQPADPQKGFCYSVYTNNGKLKPRKGGIGYSFYWGMSYGRKTTAMLANLCYGRYLQLPAGTNKEKYRLLVVNAADGYLDFDPDLSAGEIWPVEYGMVIFTELAAHKLTNQKKYLQRAQTLCDDALQLFWDKKSPLPKASSKLNHYEAVTRADTLLLALLAVYVESNDLPIKVPFSNIDR